MDLIEAMKTNVQRVRIENEGTNEQKTYMTYGMLARAIAEDEPERAAEIHRRVNDWQSQLQEREAFNLGYADVMNSQP